MGFLPSNMAIWEDEDDQLMNLGYPTLRHNNVWKNLYV